MAPDRGDKTHQPTPHRRQQMRDAGHVAQSHDLTSIGILLGGLAGLIVAGGALMRFLVDLLIAHLGGAAWRGWLASDRGADTSFVELWNPLVLGISKSLLPLLIVTLIVGLALSFLQTGPRFLPAKLVPDLSRVNPVTGLGRMFSSASGARLAFGFVRTAAIVGIAGTVLYGRREQLISVAALEVDQLAALIWELCLWTSVKIGLGLAAVAVLDYGYQRWQYERNMKMTTQELREEIRNLQGDPAVSARRKTVRAQMITEPLPSKMSRAAVVVADKAIAVALEYADAMSAPHLLMRGAGPTAKRIRELAAERNIPVVDRPALAAALFKIAVAEAPLPEVYWPGVAEAFAVARRDPEV